MVGGLALNFNWKWRPTGIIEWYSGCSRETHIEIWHWQHIQLVSPMMKVPVHVVHHGLKEVKGF